ncbi:hypothetical protein OS493_001208 [Desmophyllum pertusum]|uniref:Uncharacterized protein n=1 Tax=Desmophyllum pertusum TaxID=174260 RepID=A0A9W9ZUS8_9CNID|nr:hypothetical protein OS493_001208 [Desmophyllum pertusum]
MLKFKSHSFTLQLLLCGRVKEVFPSLDDDGIISKGSSSNSPVHVPLPMGKHFRDRGREATFGGQEMKQHLPNWSSALKKVLLVQPSSASLNESSA